MLNKLLISNLLNCDAVHIVCTSVYSILFPLNALYDLENDLGAVFSSMFRAESRYWNKSIVIRNNKDV